MRKISNKTINLAETWFLVNNTCKIRKVNKNNQLMRNFENENLRMLRVWRKVRDNETNLIKACDPKFPSRKRDVRNIKVGGNEIILREMVTKWSRYRGVWTWYRKFEILSIGDCESQLYCNYSIIFLHILKLKIVWRKITFF